MIDEGITNETYAPITGSTFSYQKKFQNFLRRSFKDKFTHYRDIRPGSYQSCRLYATAKTLKFNSLDEITVENLKFRLIISQLATHAEFSEVYSQLFETIMPK